MFPYEIRDCLILVYWNISISGFIFCYSQFSKPKTFYSQFTECIIYMHKLAMTLDHNKKCKISQICGFRPKWVSSWLYMHQQT